MCNLLQEDQPSLQDSTEESSQEDSETHKQENTEAEGATAALQAPATPAPAAAAAAAALPAPATPAAAQPAAQPAASGVRRYPLRERWPPTEWYKAALATQELKEPSTYMKAASGEDADLWRRTMDKEMTSLHANGTWILEEVPQHKTHSCQVDLRDQVGLQRQH